MKFLFAATIQLKNVVLPFIFGNQTLKAYITNTGIFFLKLIAALPFGILYFLSDILFVVIFYLAGYRKKVVYRNLEKSFPGKTQNEQRQIAHRFYRHFCDLTLETVKLNKMTEQEMKKRMKFHNHELISQFTDAGRSVTILAMHHNNWEWGTFLQSFYKSKVLAVYKPLHNPYFDKYINANRARFGAEMIKNSQVLKRILIAEKRQEPVAIWLAADQTPPFFHTSWFRFLNQEAMFYPGPAFIAKRFNTPLIFQKIEKTKRGYYTSSLELLVENPAEMEENEIIKMYIQRMEEIIRENPEYYLWSHKRWKHKRPEGIALNE